MRLAALLVISLLVATGVAMVAGDALFFFQYGVGYHDVAFVTASGETAEWPTGEQPIYAMIPAFLYAIPLWFLAAMIQLWTGKLESAPRI